MRSRLVHRIYCCSLQYKNIRKSCGSSTLSRNIHSLPNTNTKKAGLLCRNFETSRNVSLNPTSSTLRYSSSARSSISEDTRQDSSRVDDSNGEVEPIDSWEEEDEAEPEIGDGGDGGGVILQNCSWGERALSIAQEVLQEFDADMKLYAFKTSPRGYVYVRLDKLSNEYGCPGMDEIESFNRLYKKRLDEVGASGEIPDDLALEVSTPGADRLLRVPDDLLRFQDMPMVVTYVEDSDSKCPKKDGVFFLDSIETESKCCIWKLADVKENRDPSAKGRPLSRKRKDWRLKLPYHMIKQELIRLVVKDSILYK